MNENFILTDSKETADILLTAGCTLLNNVGDKWVFINNGDKLMFSSLENVVFTNNLFI